MNVLVTGATGFVGRPLVQALLARGDAVRVLSRGAQAPPGSELVRGDPGQPGEWQRATRGCAVVIHLAGESVAGGRLDRDHRQRVMHSREAGTRNVVRAIADCPLGERPRVLVSASGVDYYPFDDGERSYDEHAPAGDSFLAQVCIAWEREALAAQLVGVRVACMRTGLVLGKDGGAMARLLPIFKLGLGGRIGSGRAWQSWIGLDDTVGAYLHAVDHPGVTGPVNVVAPGPVRQLDFARALAQALHRPAILHTPELAIKLVTGGMARYVLGGRRAVPSALAMTGHVFAHPELEGALQAMLAA
jgi:uncharacterized protein (TIGR01777 family)